MPQVSSLQARYDRQVCDLQKRNPAELVGQVVLNVHRPIPAAFEPTLDVDVAPAGTGATGGDTDL